MWGRTVGADSVSRDWGRGESSWNSARAHKPAEFSYTCWDGMNENRFTG